MPPLVFISHSLHGTPQAPLLDELERELRRDGRFEPFIDSFSLKGGDPWRSKIFHKLGRCRAAVLILTPKVVRDDGSRWVPLEALILRYRTWMEPAFKLIPVWLDLGAADFTLPANPDWEPLAIQELQAISCTTAELDQIPGRISDALGVLPGTPTSTYELQVQNIARQFHEIQEDDIGRVCQSLSPSCPPPPDTPDPATLFPPAEHLARMLLGQGLKVFPRFVREIKRPVNPTSADFPGQKQRNILKLIMASWVSLEAASLIPRYVCSQMENRVFAVNRHRQKIFFARSYLRCGSGQAEIGMSNWDAIYPAISHSEDVEACLLEELRKELCKLLYDDEDEIPGDEDELDEHMNEIMEQCLHQDPVNPTFAVLSFPAGIGWTSVKPLIRRVHERYPDLILFLMLGDCSDEEIPLLQPLPEIDRVKQAYLENKAAKRAIIKDN